MDLGSCIESLYPYNSEQNGEVEIINTNNTTECVILSYILLLHAQQSRVSEMKRSQISSQNGEIVIHSTQFLKCEHPQHGGKETRGDKLRRFTSHEATVEMFIIQWMKSC